MSRLLVVVVVAGRVGSAGGDPEHCLSVRVWPSTALPIPDSRPGSSCKTRAGVQPGPCRDRAF